jgi:putative NADH-flavin reductase
MEPMKLAILGATGFIGSEVVVRALAAGHQVSALSRRAATLPVRPGLVVVEGDAADQRALARLLAGADAVVSCVGGTGDLAAIMAGLLDAMRAARIRRLVAVSGAGISVDGERKPLRHRLLSAVVRSLAAKAVAAKQAEYDVLSASEDIDWVTLRPPRVVDGSPSGKARPSVDASDMAFRVSRGDVAALMLEELTDDRFLRRPVYIATSLPRPQRRAPE